MPPEFNLRRGQGVGLVDEVAVLALSSHSFGGKSAGGLDGAHAFLSRISQRAHKSQQGSAQT